MTTDFLSLEEFQQKLAVRLEAVYPNSDIKALTRECIRAIGARLEPDSVPPEHPWSEKDSLLITYGGTLQQPGEKALHTLQHFLHDYLRGVISAVHILPFFPYSSDDGFAVIDYTRVDPELGQWSDISEIASEFKLMADLVINHASRESGWFKNFQYGKGPGRDYFVQASPDEDLSAVVRPRSQPLLQPVETAEGVKYVWCTFGFDQVDLDFSNPEVLLEFIRVIGLYLEKGVRCLRLDAVAFLWKQIGTSCLHLPQTHEIVKLLRLLAEYKNSGATIVSETNVPHRENLTYFGNSNEAHAVYNFSLPPLILNALMCGDSKHLDDWMMTLPPPPPGCTYLNFTASHDGIGLRPAEGLIGENELRALIATMHSFGARISMRTRADGSQSPYEINVSLFDAMRGTHKGTDRWQIERFLCSQIIMMGLQGIPAFYIHSLLATPNDLDKLQATEQNRAINRRHWAYAEIERLLEDRRTSHARVFNELRRLILIRCRQPAFHPNAAQFALHLQPALFGVWRQSLDKQRIYCIHNLSDSEQDVPLTELNLASTDRWTDLISGGRLSDLYTPLTLQPYQCIWLSNRVFNE